MTREESWILKEKYNNEKSEGFFIDCKRLQEGEPLAYIIGHIPFLNSTIYLDSHPLIPRPETEYWVEKAITNIQSVSTRHPLERISVLDLCTGSGAIAIAVASTILNTEIDAVEIDTAHNSTIHRTMSLNSIPEHTIHLYNGDLFQSLPPQKKYDFILSNPPYINEDAKTAEKSVTDFEPALALFGGINGFEIIERIIEQSRTHLKPGGELWIEHEPSQSERIKTCTEKNNFSSVTHTDQYGVLRYSILTPN